jgi:hypothetical protein
MLLEMEDASFPGSWSWLLSDDDLGEAGQLAAQPPAVIMVPAVTEEQHQQPRRHGDGCDFPPFSPPSQASRVPSPLPDDDDHVWEGLLPPTTPTAGTSAYISQAGHVHVTPSPLAARRDTLQAPHGMPHLARLGEGTNPHLQVPVLDGAGRPPRPRPRPRRGPRTNRRGGRLGPLGLSRRGGAGQGRGGTTGQGRGGAGQGRGGTSQGRAQPQPPRIRRHQPQVMTPVQLMDGDVACERGGRNISHPGNKSFRKHIEDIVEMMLHESIHKGGRSYSDLSVKEKTALSLSIVDWVGTHQGGRFVARDKIPGRAGKYGPWYQVLRETARQKASQYLRDVHKRLTRPTDRPTTRTRMIPTKSE